MRMFETDSIDLAAFLVTSGYTPFIYCKPDLRRASFEFPETDELRDAIISYERGAVLPAKQLLNTRSFLFREVKRVTREGGEL